MKISTLKAIEKALERDLSDAQDNLIRSQRAFGGSNRDEEWGQSGRSKGEIEEGYQSWYNQAKEALNDFNLGVVR